MIKFTGMLQGPEVHPEQLHRLGPQQHISHPLCCSNRHSCADCGESSVQGMRALFGALMWQLSMNMHDVCVSRVDSLHELLCCLMQNNHSCDSNLNVCRR